MDQKVLNFATRYFSRVTLYSNKRISNYMRKDQKEQSKHKVHTMSNCDRQLTYNYIHIEYKQKEAKLFELINSLEKCSLFTAQVFLLIFNEMNYFLCVLWDDDEANDDEDASVN